MACSGSDHNLPTNVSRETLLYNTNKLEVVVRLLRRHNGHMNSNQYIEEHPTEVKYLAEAKAILDKGEWIAMQVIVGLLKDAGWEPEGDGWVQRKG